MLHRIVDPMKYFGSITLSSTLDITARMCSKPQDKVYRPLCLWCSVSSAAACRDADQQGGTDRSTRLSRPHPHSQSIHTLSIQRHSSLVATHVAAVTSTHTFELPTKNVSVQKVLQGLSLPLWKSLWCLLRRRKAEWLPGSRSPFSLDQACTIFLLHCCLF